MEIDYKILDKKYTTDRLKLNQTNKTQYILNLVRLISSLHKLSKYDAFVVWFGDYHSALVAFIKLLLNKKMVLFIGGYDAVCYPDKKIGVYNNKFRGAFTRYAIKHSDLIIANHSSLIESNNLYIDGKDRRSGLKNIIPGFKTRYAIIYNGTDVTKADSYDKVKEDKLVLTTGATANWEDIYNKGYDLLIEVARMLPEYKFIFVGISDGWLSRLETEFHYQELTNLKILPLISQKELFKLFNKAKIYAQPSISEGMPNALMEAMLFECIPVGSNVAGIPTVIDKFGIILYERKAELLADAIKKANTLPVGKDAGEFIKQNFTFEARANSIYLEMDKVLKD
jgi:glycosyltransferase involved in cell wall biosynthesis